MINLEQNKKLYLDLVSQINRPGIDKLIEYLTESDFFTAPASTKFHLNTKGGLCQHSLNVYNNLIDLINIYGKDNRNLVEFDKESIIIVALFHDLAKVNFYEEYIKNEKQYFENGKYDWVAVPAYRLRDNFTRENVFHSHEVNSYMVVNRYIKLTEEEAVAIMNHHAVFDNGNARLDISEVYNRYPLATLLHTADTLATYLDENPYQQYESDN